MPRGLAALRAIHAKDRGLIAEGQWSTTFIFYLIRVQE